MKVELGKGAFRFGTAHTAGLLVLVTSLAALVFAGAAGSNPRGINGKIVYSATSVTDVSQAYTIDPDGTDRQLVPHEDAAAWSPDGTRILLFDQLFNPDDGSLTDLGLAALYPELFLPCLAWSPDGGRLACEGFGQTDPGLNGIYTVRSSDGGDLQQLTSDPGGDDCPGDYSPNGKRIAFLRANDAVFALFTVKLDGRGLRQLTPDGMELNFECGSWSPQGNEILFSARVPNSDYRLSVWAVHPSGSGLRQIPIPGCGGPFASPTSIGCFHPSWSPDGKKIVFGRLPAATGQADLYTVNADGSDLFQVTNTPDLGEGGGPGSDWGTHPVTP